MRIKNNFAIRKIGKRAEGREEKKKEARLNPQDIEAQGELKELTKNETI